MNILEDVNELRQYDIFEDIQKNGSKKYIMRGIFSEVDRPNLNKRIYPRLVMEESLNDLSSLIQQRGFLGELDHAPTPKINVERISHVITKMQLTEDGRVIGELEVLDTPHGKILQKLMEARVRIGVSTRGLGEVKPYSGHLGEGLVEVQKGYKIKALDVVCEPSSHNAIPQQIIESKVYVGGVNTRNYAKVWEDVFNKKIK